jgi:hypothetical protein
MQGPAEGPTFRCLMRVHIREALAEDSARCATLTPGTVAPVLEQRFSPGGTPCIRTHKGWLSEHEKSGARTIEYIDVERWQKAHWVSDDATACASCFTLFGVFNRKHHCRQCGDIFCHSCSSNTHALSHLGYTTPERVCTVCYDRLRGAAAEPATVGSGGDDRRAGGRASACEPPPSVRGAAVTDDVLRMLVIVRDMMHAAQGQTTYMDIKSKLRTQFGEVTFDRAKAHAQLLLRDGDSLSFVVNQPSKVVERLPVGDRAEKQIGELRPGQIIFGLVDPVAVPGKKQLGQWTAHTILLPDGERRAGWTALNAADGSTQLSKGDGSAAPGAGGAKDDVSAALEQHTR